MWLLVASLLLCACANGLAIEEDQTPVYETFANAGNYLFLPAPQNWTDASKVCMQYNGHLAYPKTQGEADALWSIMSRYKVNHTHAGFHDQFVEGEYYTAKGRQINETSFKQWSAWAPIGGTAFNCGGLRIDGIVDVACNDIFPSICEENEPSLHYEYLEGHGYFRVNDEDVTWPDALMRCYNEGSHLWIINSEKERADVYDKLSLTNMSSLAFWAGFHQRHADSYFVTVYDDPLETTGYSTWAPGYPTGNLSYPYGAISSLGLEMRNNTTLKSVCEFNAPN